MSEMTLNVTLHGPHYDRLPTFYSLMIAYDIHQCVNHFHFCEESNCNNNYISHIIPKLQKLLATKIESHSIPPMYHYVRNDFKRHITWF